VLAESFLTGNSLVTNNASVALGALFNPGGAQDLVFSYAVVPAAPLGADFDSDGDVDGADFLTWQRGLGTAAATKAQGDADGDADVDGADLGLWKSQFGGGAFSGPGVLLTSFVRYVSSAAPVPEPSSVVLAGLGVAVVTVGAWKRRRDA
jgi:hypothetical protein